MMKLGISFSSPFSPAQPSYTVKSGHFLTHTIMVVSILAEASTSKFARVVRVDGNMTVGSKYNRYLKWHYFNKIDNI